jgi:hypothetical protein
MSPERQLRLVRALLTPEGAWLPLSFGAADATGRPCGCRAPEARRWGVLAGLVHLGGPLDERIRAVDHVRRTVASKWLHTWEEERGRSQAEILDALDRAIDQASAENWS